ncbi:MAG TPA: alkaline phosphatase family protein [Allosphingosinicella sp.]|jgi:predicted AlkP superfamily pyrophosphatase or phosphodiesterase
MLKHAAILLSLAFAAAPAAALAQAAPATQDQAAPAPQGPPRLIVAISVDQFSADLFAQYRPYFTGGLRRLSSGGVVFPSGYQAHAATETCPGHSTILTGSRPSRTGIIANNWFDVTLPREDKRVYCSEDPSAPGSSSRDNAYRVSGRFLRVPALGEYMKRLNPASRVVAVAGKDRSAIMMGGRQVDQRWWWTDRDLFNNQNEHPASPALTAANQAIERALGAPREAMPMPALCEARSRIVPIEQSERPLSVGAHRFARAAGARESFRRSPELDGATLALGMALQGEMRLGQGSATDLLILGLASTDYVGHTYGTQGAEMCLNMLELDRALGDFFGRLDRSGIDYMVVLTADHGGLDIPERMRANGGVDAWRTPPELAPSAMDRAIRTAFNLPDQLLWGEGPFGDFYVSRSLSSRDRARVIAEAIRRYRASPRVAQVFTHAELRAAPNPSGPPESWSLLDRAKASFDPERSGDFVVLLHPRVTPIARPGPTYTATHGSPWDYDRRVPIMFWRRGMAPFEQSGSVETVDILPTLAPFLGIAIRPGTIDGRCLDLVEGPASSCRR